MRGPKPKHSLSGALIDLTACFLIPAYTLLFAGSRQWFSTNFSVIAVMGEDHYRGFFFWGLLMGSYFLPVLLGLGRFLPRRRHRAALAALSLSAIGCLTAALVVPYLPVLPPRWADLHVVLAFSACVLLMAAILVLRLAFRREKLPGCGRLFFRWWGIVIGSGILFLLCGIISSALEIFFALSTSLLVRTMWHRAHSAHP